MTFGFKWKAQTERPQYVHSCRVVEPQHRSRFPSYVINGGEMRLTGPSAELAGHPDFEAAYFGLLDGVPD